VSGAVDEFKDVVVGNIQVEHNCSILVNAASSELLVKTAIDFAKRNRPRCNESFAVVSSCGPELTEMDCNASSIS
jgi:hypothetical protein